MSNAPRIIDGALVAETVLAECRAQIETLRTQGHTPGLAVVLVGDNPASRSYVRAKDRMCQKIGMHSVKLELPAETTQAELLDVVAQTQRRSHGPRHPRAIAAAPSHRRGRRRAGD